MFPRQLNTTMTGRIFAAHDSPKTRWKNIAPTSCPDCLISSFGIAATYATLVRRNKIDTSVKAIRPAFRTVRTGSPRTSPSTLKELAQPTKAKCVLTNAVARAFPLKDVPAHGSLKLENGSLMRVIPERTASPATTTLRDSVRYEDK